MKKYVLSCVFLLFSVFLFAQSNEPQIIITTPGYASIYCYSLEDFSIGIQRDLRIQNASVTDIHTSPDLTILIGEKEYKYSLSESNNIVRLIYDRNRRNFKGVGCNYVESDTVCYELPRFKGLTPDKLPELWYDDLERKLTDKSLLKDNEPNVFVLEADIDENGHVHKIVELTGALKQYSKVIIDKVYDAAVRGWEPATRNGRPCRTLAQIRFVIEK